MTAVPTAPGAAAATAADDAPMRSPRGGSVPEQPGPGFTALVVDDHPLVRESMVTRLRAMGARDVAEAASYAEARARARSGVRDLAVLDLGLPDGSGLELLAAAAQATAGAGWSCCPPPTIRTRCARRSSPAPRGTCSRAPSPVTVSDGVRRVLDGGVYADPAVASLLAAGLRGTPGASDGLASELSGREVEVLRLVADGQSNKEIGEQLGLSALTVKSHLARIARKLGTGDRAEMVALAMRAGVIR